MELVITANLHLNFTQLVASADQSNKIRTHPTDSQATAQNILWSVVHFALWFFSFSYFYTGTIKPLSNYNLIHTDSPPTTTRLLITEVLLTQQQRMTDEKPVAKVVLGQMGT